MRTPVRNKSLLHVVAAHLLLLLAPSWAAHAAEVWTTDFAAAKTAAEQTGRPLAVVCGRVGCEHCADLKAAMQSSEFAAWGRRGDVDICYVEMPKAYKDSTADQLAGFDFCYTQWSGSCQKPTEFPFVALYRAVGGNESKVNFGGQDGIMYAGTRGDTLARQLIESLEAFFFNAPDIRGAFVADTYPSARLEWDDTTTTLAVPVRRAAADALVAATNTVIAEAGGTQVKAPAGWAAGETDAYAVIDVRPFAGQEKINLYLSNLSAEHFATNSITYSPENENNPKNPRFIGERTVETLAWGEWTMDLDVATQKVAAASAEGAATLVLVGGSLWCPDCYSTDRYLIETDAFRNWAAERKIACVAIDVVNPADATANTSLLTWDTADTCKGDPTNVKRQRYVTCNYGTEADWDLRYESGAGYLSRHGILPEAAAAVAARNKWLLNNSTAVGGLCRPEDIATDNGRTGSFKTGIPCLIALRPDGTVAGRIYQFNNVSASSDEHLAAYIARLDELFDQVGAPEEETNDDALTTDETCLIGTPVEGTLSAVDGRDTYRIASAKDMRMVFTLTGTSVAGLTLTAFDMASGARDVLGTVTGSLADGVVLTTRTTSASCYLEVGYPKDANGYATGAELDFTKVGPTVCAYALATDGTMSGGDIGFTRTALDVSEDCEGAASKKVQLSVGRTGGTSGRVTVRVVLQPTAAAVAALREGYVAWTDQEIVWEDGHAETKPVELTVFDNDWEDDDLPLTFALELVSATAADAAVTAGTSQQVVTIVDNDSKAVMAYRNVKVDETRTIAGWQEGDEIVLAKASGSAPSGVAFSAVDGALVASGRPTRAGSYAVSYQVMVLRNGSLVSSAVETFAFVVRDVDFAVSVPSLTNATTYANLPVLAGGEVAGLLTLTVPPSGKLSAKYRTKGKTCSYSTSGWSSYERWDGVLAAELVRTGTSGERLTVTLQGDTGAFVLEDPLGSGELSGEFSLATWRAGDPASAWQGQYVVQLAQTDVVDKAPFARLAGDGFLALRMVTATAVRNGQMLYAGILPNGRAVSGRSVLLRQGVASSFLPFYSYKNSSLSPYAFSGVFEIMANPWNVGTLGTRWSVYAVDGAKTCWSVPDGYGRSADFAVYGAYYDASELRDCYLTDFGKRAEAFKFCCSSAGLGSGRYGTGAAFEPVLAEVTEDNDLVVAEDTSVRLVFSPSTGVAHGVVRLPFASGASRLVTFRGIVLPGWGACEDCHLGGAFATRPFLSGAAWFADGDGVGSWRNGCRIEVNVSEEE